MACLNFEFMLVGQILLDDAASTAAHKVSAPNHHHHHHHHQRQQRQQQSSRSSLLQPRQDSLCYNPSFLNPCSPAHLDSLDPFYERDKSPESPCSAAFHTLYTIREEVEEEEEEEEDDDDCEIDAPFLRFFKSCFVQFVYMMPMDKAVKSPPLSP